MQANSSRINVAQEANANNDDELIFLEDGINDLERTHDEQSDILANGLAHEVRSHRQQLVDLVGRSSDIAPGFRPPMLDGQKRQVV